MRRFLTRSLFFLACLATIIAAIYVEEKIRGRAAWKAYEVEAKQRGVKVDYAEFIPPKIPDAENFASIPIFEEVFRAEDASPQVSYPTPLTLPRRPTDPPNAVGWGSLPKLSNPSTQQRIDLAAWQQYFVEVKLLPVAGENAAADTLKALEGFAVPLAQLHEAGSRPRCRFPVHYERTYEAGLPHLGVLQRASTLWALRLAAHLELGQSAEAYESWRDGLRFLVLSAEEPTIINALVRVSCLQPLVNGVWGGLAAHQWAEPELRKIEADLATLDWLRDYVFAMSCERGSLNSMADAMIDSPVELAKILKIIRSMQNDFDASRAPAWVWRFYPTGWLYQGKLKTNQYFDEAIARIDPHRQRCFVERNVTTLPENLVSRAAKFYYLIFAQSTPVFQGMEKRFVWTASVTAMARLACALERYRLAHGNFPAALDDLTPEYLAVLPVEIVNGEPFRYRRGDEGGFLLYSVGLDLHDDGGSFGPNPLKTDRQPDWVWRVPAKAVVAK